MVPVADTPPTVGRLAAEQQLGHLLAARAGTSRRSSSVGFLLAAAGALGVGLLLGWWATASDTRRLGYAALTLVCALFPVLLVWGIRLFVRGTHGYYLFEGGLVHERNGRPRLVRWQQIGQLRRRRLGEKAAQFARGMPGMEAVTADTVAGYDVLPAGGGRLTIHMGGVREPGYASFCQTIETYAVHGGARVTG